MSDFVQKMKAVCGQLIVTAALIPVIWSGPVLAVDRLTERINKSALLFPGCNDAVRQAVLENSDGSLNYLVPDWRGLEPYEMTMYDGTQDIAGLETVVAKYKVADGSRTATYAIGHNVFAVDIIDAGGAAYTLVDENGDGLFTQLVCTDEHFDVPRWVMR